jgi:hypothetical protein
MLLMFPYRNHNNDHSSPLQRYDGRGGVEEPVSPSTVPQTSSSSPSSRRNRAAGAGMKAAGATAAAAAPPPTKEPRISGKNNNKKKTDKAREKELDDYDSAEVANVAGRAGGKTPPRMTSVDDSTMLPEWCVPILFSLFLVLSLIGSAAFSVILLLHDERSSSISFVSPILSRIIDYTRYTPSDDDVIVSWARQNHAHRGNERFRMLVEKYAPVYAKASTKYQKSEVIAAIVSEVRRGSKVGGELYLSSKGLPSKGVRLCLFIELV